MTTVDGHWPPRSVYPYISDGIWEMIKGCWNSDPSQRPTITKIIVILEAELNHQWPRTVCSLHYVFLFRVRNSMTHFLHLQPA
jgi:hypothetical protein